MTPIARDLLTRIIDEYEAPDTSGASDFKEDV